MRSRMEAAIEDKLVLLSLSTFSISFTFIIRLFRNWFFNKVLKILSTEYFFTVLSLTRNTYKIFTTSSKSLLLIREDSQANLQAYNWTMSSLLRTCRPRKATN